MDKIIITKVDSTEPSKKKTAKSYPKSSLKTAKIKPVADPAKAPPTKKSMRKHTIRLFTNNFWLSWIPKQNCQRPRKNQFFLAWAIL
jgi:hypothetical protein